MRTSAAQDPSFGSGCLKALLRQPRSTAPALGYAYALTCCLALLIVAPFQMLKFRVSRGIPTRLLSSGVVQAESSLRTTGLLVYIDRNGKLFLNSKPVTASQLPRALEAEFARRADWSVYVEGDSDANYGDVIRAMDQVRAAHGAVIILTPELRTEIAAASTELFRR